MWVWFLIDDHHFKCTGISHLPSAGRMRHMVPLVLAYCLVQFWIHSHLWHVKHKRLLAWVSANWTSVESVCCVICSSVPIQECSRRHFDLPWWKDSSKDLNSETPWNWYSPTLGFIIADGLLHDSCWIQLYRQHKPLKGFNPGYVGENRLDNIKVMQWHQWCYGMCSKESKQVPIHVILIQINQQGTLGIRYRVIALIIVAKVVLMANESSSFSINNEHLRENQNLLGLPLSLWHRHPNYKKLTYMLHL